jgi:CDP-6-deoxy-D-xylo-4-hexulose-3-dehydrase
MFRKKKYFYPLLKNGFSNKDINEGIKVLKTKFITMGKNTEKFEKIFSKKLGVKYSVMVNSGSSANLLAVFASCNPMRKNIFKPGDEAIIPALCWSTSLWPLVQCGLKPKFIDVNPETLNVDADDLIKKINKKTKVIMIINILGLSSDLKKIKNFIKDKKIILIEDNCESLGSKFKNKYLGTYGDFGTFSFFYSHPITSGEGGMVVCNNDKDYEILQALRSHGWSRGEFHEKIKKKYPQLDSRYIFYNSGFNLRPTDINASIGLSQFNRLDKVVNARFENKKRIIKALISDKRWNNQFHFINDSPKTKPSYMVLPILLDERYNNKKNMYINILERGGIETRPIISGNFLNQPAAKLYKFKQRAEEFVGAQKISDLGFVIGLHTEKTNKNTIKKLVDRLYQIEKL